MANIIQSFSIYGLFGTRDVHIPFNESVKIMVGENGIGKTQILKIFYYTLIGDLEKLYELPFNRILLKIVDNTTIEISKQVLEIYIYEKWNLIEPYLNWMKTLMGSNKFAQLFQMVENSLEINNETKAINYIDKFFYRIYGDNNNYTRNHILKIFKREIAYRKNNNAHILSADLVKVKNQLKKYFPRNAILYFPTFRRIEEDLHNLGYDENLSAYNENSLIHFGMKDVEADLKTIENKMNELLKIGFSEISSKILSHLIKDAGNVEKNVLEQINEKDIDIILARVGKEIPEPEKKRIRQIVLEKETEDKDAYLLYFLQTLIQIYEKQRPLDDTIKRFQKVCNRYLVNKQVFYDESEIKIYIQSEETNEALELSKLSSGEKQIISIFSKIYLAEKDERFLVLFDEPELSLSMLWQKQLLPDIMDSGKCDFLFAVTHSPFIFDNKLDQYAIGLSEYIQPSTQNISA